MVLEHALLSVGPGQEAEFESAFTEARSIIAAAPGFCGLTLSRCVQRPTTYLLLVQWQRVEDHTEGFRASPGYERWKRLLHHFYDPFPLVQHYEQVQSVS